MNINREELLATMNLSRQSTFSLFDWLTDETRTRRSPHPGFRPMLWHLAHIGAFEEWWLLIRLRQEPPVAPRYQVIFDPIKTPREESENLPSRSEIEHYLTTIRSRVEHQYLDHRKSTPTTSGFEEDYILNLVLEHEYQHQETLSYLLQMLPPEVKQEPSSATNLEAHRADPYPKMVRIEGRSFPLGGSGRFVYDNEEPVHMVDLADFFIDRFPVTNGEYLEFISAGGYENESLWSEAGWGWKETNQISCPLYWTLGETWEITAMFERQALRSDCPVTGVSWYEAEAFARFAGKRLPSEAEWERAAAWDPRKSTKLWFPWGDEPPNARLCNFNGNLLSPSPVGVFPRGTSPSGCLDMAGNVWEWTSTNFGPYPGFRAYPYPDYSELWFDGDHRVLKGGSWMTRTPLLRSSFRNFFRPGFRFAFAGFRLSSS